MSRLIKRYYERWLLGLVLMAVGLSLSWFWQKQVEVRRIKTLPVAVRLLKSDYVMTDTREVVAGYTSWPKPVAQSAGGGWIYELFTPPVVFYNQPASVFSVKPPADLSEIAPIFNLELISVRRELYRLQLRGYFGEPGSYTVAFTQPESPGTLFLKEGDRLADHGLVLQRFSVQKMPLEPSGEFELIALAELQDEKSEKVVTLDSRRPKFNDAPIATVRISSPTGVAREVHVGDVIEDEGCTYKIAQIQYAPAEILVMRSEPGLPNVETRSLHPVDRGLSNAPDRSMDSPHFPSRPATGLVTNDR